MLDLKFIRGNPEIVKEGVCKKGYEVDIDRLLAMDAEHRQLLTELEGQRADLNRISKEIGLAVKEKKDIGPLKEQAATISSQIGKMEDVVLSLAAEIRKVLERIPNLPQDDVPVGPAEANVIVREWGSLPEFSFEPKPHWDIAEALGIIDFPRAAKIAGANFALYKGLGARLERALYNFMLDIHTQKHGYKEVFTPFLVNRQAMFGTGQLPLLEEDMYRLKDDDMFLIPTAEVPVTNIYSNEVLSEEELPIYLCAYSACFRREAGSYGKDTRGLLRVHQFDKVELVKFVLPERSKEEHEALVRDAEDILQALGVPYRVVLLASRDMSFAAAKCYDIEIYAAGCKRWLEVSSCSNFEGFQARRANIRFRRGDKGRPEFVHTLNGSGVALARLVAVIIENNQQEDGSVNVPQALVPYMGGVEKIV